MVFAIGYNSSKHSSTEMTPFELCYGRHARLPVESSIASLPGPVLATEYAKEMKSAMLHAREVVDQEVTAAQARQQRYYGKQYQPEKQRLYEKGQWCFCREKQSNRDYHRS